MIYLGGAIAIGLLSNLHCLGMCGPIALALPLNRSNFFTRTLGVLAYNSGRILTYAALGAVLGLFGEGLHFFGLQQTFSIVLGALIILFALLPGLLQKEQIVGGGIYRWTQNLKTEFGKHFRKSSYSSLFMIGLLNGLLPCGMVYIALAGALAASSWQQGALFMALFGAGTLPVMFSLPLVVSKLTSPLRARIRKFLPIIAIGMGLLLILRGSNLGIPYLSPKSQPNAQTEAPECH
ncbi:sulfite exporter TauE/SafE family protein [bacterium SCSIO 12741]|nr:sulfite exporter TauE/SafE family protein [bacterium SCSIO 12741]